MSSLCSVLATVSILATSASAAGAQTSEPPSTGDEFARPASPLDLVTVAAGDAPLFPGPYRGFRLDGAAAQEEVRVYGTAEVSLLHETGSAGRCGQSYWAVRWRSLSPDTDVIASAVPSPLPYQWVASDLQLMPAGSAGLVVGTQCTIPAFYRVGNDPSLLVDVVYEEQWYTASVDEGDGPPMPSNWELDEPVALPMWEHQEVDCVGYNVAGDPPYSPCVQSFRIAVVQGRLTALGFPVDDDGYFGEDTLNAVAEYQQSVGLAPDGHVGIQTWRALLDGATEMLVFDQDGNGLIEPSEIPLGE